MKIAVIQSKANYSYNCGKEQPALDFLRKKSAAMLDDCFEMLAEARREKAELAVTIEAVNSILGYGDTRWPLCTIHEDLNGPICERFADFARKNAMHIVAGLIIAFGDQAYNCGVLFDSKGEIAGVHKKVHLPAGEELQIAHGDKFEVFTTDIGNIGMLICWDLQFPESVRELTLGGADLIACPTLGWENIYGLARAYESSVYIVGSMGIGFSGLPDFCDPSCIVDNMGNIICAASRDKAEVIVADVDITKEPVPQYGSEHYINSFSMRQTRLSQRRPGTYKLTGAPIEDTPLYRRYRWDSDDQKIISS